MDTGETKLPPAGAALDHVGTRAALERGLRDASVMLGLGAASLGVAIVTLPGSYDGGSIARNSWILASAVVLLIGSFGCLRSVRMKRLLEQTPWVTRHCRLMQGDRPAEASLLLLADDTFPEGASIPLHGSDWDVLAPCNGDRVWLAGEPADFAIVAPPGADELVVVGR